MTMLIGAKITVRGLQAMIEYIITITQDGVTAAVIGACIAYYTLMAILKK